MTSINTKLNERLLVAYEQDLAEMSSEELLKEFGDEDPEEVLGLAKRALQENAAEKPFPGAPGRRRQRGKRRAGVDVIEAKRRDAGRLDIVIRATFSEGEEAADPSAVDSDDDAREE